jgi:hypothetical protein
MKPTMKSLISFKICHCRVLNLPVINTNDMINIIRYKLIAYYPGSVHDLAIDYITEGENVIVFYMNLDDLESLKKRIPNGRFYSPYHVLSDRKEKEGLYYIPLNGRLEILRYSRNLLTESYSIDDSPENRKSIETECASIEDSFIVKEQCIPLFRKKRCLNYTFQILLLFTLIVSVPQFFYYFQIKSEETSLLELEKTLNIQVENDLVHYATEKERDELKSSYERILRSKPINVYVLLSDLTELLGENTEIVSLVLKNNTFQMNCVGLSILEKMEEFQKDSHFQSVIPYQVHPIEGSEKERFSLTGIYANE